MNCPEARVRIGAEPGVMSDALAGHLRGCVACSDFRREMIALDGNIRRALETPAPVPAPAQRPKFVRARPFSERWALAASVVLTLAIGVSFWALPPRESLARDVAAHVAGEPASWGSTARLSQSVVDYVLRDVGVSLDAEAHYIAYARACPFRGRTVPHLVVRTAQGPVTVLVLRGERIRSATRFSEDGYSGMLLPAPEGGLAVLARGLANVEAAAREVQQAIRPQAPELTHTAAPEWLDSTPSTS
ncbi:MAG TPA: DUF3379 family protein [Steroidobacteraceae bacterium]|nr:DUF3379 family protein [Steroidobacteraceae bacterium]